MPQQQGDGTAEQELYGVAPSNHRQAGESEQVNRLKATDRDRRE
jgi:hypothetical protein